MASLLDKLKSPDPDNEFAPEFSDKIPGELAEDPAPEKRGSRVPKLATGTRATAAPKPARKPVPANVRKQVADELHAYLEMAAMTWGLRDDYCATALSDASREIADKLAEIIARNPKLVEWVHTTGLVGDWLKLAMAIQPVVSAIRAHHVSRTVGGDDDSAPDFDRFPAYRPATA